MNLGVCSWSLRPESPAALEAKVRECGLSAVQLALDPIRRGEWGLGDTQRTLGEAGITILSGMMGMRGEDYATLASIRRTGGVRPSATWPENVEAAKRNADIAASLGLTLVTFHAGFIPEDPADEERGVMIERLLTLIDIFDERDVRIGLETGQEPAHVVRRLIDDMGVEVGVNFDPANMILYGMGDPVESLDLLAEHVVQIHIKDALSAGAAGAWGTEVPVGTGEVQWDSFFGVIADRGLDVDLVIERESGKCRVEDVVQAADLVRRHHKVGA